MESFEINDNNETMNEPAINENNRFTSRKYQTSGFTGKDFTKPIKKVNPFSGIFSGLFGNSNNQNERGKDLSSLTNNKRKKIIIGGVAAFAFLFLVGGYILAFQSSSIDITLDLKKENISTSANIVVDPDAVEMSSDPITIPGVTLQEENLSISRTGEANGSGVKGEKAKGLIDIINKTSEEILLKAGTKLTSVATSKLYVLVNDKTIPGGEMNGEVIEAKRVEDIQVEASELGDSYNIKSTDSNTDFIVADYPRSKLQATRYADFTGGTSEEFISVSEENFNKLKGEVLEEIKKQGENKIKTAVPNGYKLLSETLEFKEDKLESMPAVGEEAKEKNFTVTATGTVSAVIVKNEDLEEAIKRVIEENKDDSGEVAVEGIEDLVIDKVEKQEGTLILSVSSTGSLTKDLTIDDIKEDLKGKSIDEARDYLGILDEVEKYRITFNPDIVPVGLRRIPADMNRINIKTR